MTHPGARGETAAEIARVLRLPTAGHDVDYSTLTKPLRELKTRPKLGLAALAGALGSGETPAVVVLPANRVWVDAGADLAPDYTRALEKGFEVTPGAANIQSDLEDVRDAVNGWVGRSTRGKIRDLLALGQVTPATRLILAGALHLKARWAAEFDDGATKPAAFTRDDGTAGEVAMMRRVGRLGLVLTGDGTAAVRLPYDRDRPGTGRLVFTAILPPGG